jgi:hypothetical protein
VPDAETACPTLWWFFCFFLVAIDLLSDGPLRAQAMPTAERAGGSQWIFNGFVRRIFGIGVLYRIPYKPYQSR